MSCMISDLLDPDAIFLRDAPGRWMAMRVLTVGRGAIAAEALTLYAAHSIMIPVIPAPALFTRREPHEVIADYFIERSLRGLGTIPSQVFDIYNHVSRSANTGGDLFALLAGYHPDANHNGDKTT